MKTYTIIESNEKRGTIKHKSFNKLSDAISELSNICQNCARYGRIVKSAVKSFKWKFEDEYNTEFESSYKIESND